MLVVKIGGASGVNIKSIVADIATQTASGEKLIVVHGGSELATELGEQLGYPPQFVTSASGHTSRYTDKRTLEIFLMATGLLNRRLVGQLQNLGVNAFGLSGLDGRLLLAERKSTIRIVDNGKRKILRDDYTGRIETVNIKAIRALQDAGHIPVVAPVAISESGEALNVDGDRAAARLAGTVEADTLVILSNVSGLLSDLEDPNSYIPRISANDMDDAINNIARGRMKRKLIAAREALDDGVKQVIIANGKIDQPITKALKGEGTLIND
ncbi:MAG: acetylglutamate kinase [Anaerolineaceae bacterium]|nr:acetylglutamate kinase [Anaerolineaceae bacterium]|tara:strand:+ start:2080 stop:2886 length:807 start_codon:yes stop_codon:yes gene_type:complete